MSEEQQGSPAVWRGALHRSRGNREDTQQAKKSPCGVPELRAGVCELQHPDVGEASGGQGLITLREATC